MHSFAQPITTVQAAKVILRTGLLDQFRKAAGKRLTRQRHGTDRKTIKKFKPVENAIIID